MDQRIGAALRSVRRWKGWSQEELARKARVSQPRVSRIERGHIGSMRLDDVRRVAAALDIRIDLYADMAPLAEALQRAL